MDANLKAKQLDPKKPIRTDFKRLAVGLTGLLSMIVGFLLAIGLSTPVGVVLGCADNSYSYGCGVPGFVLGILVALVLTPIFLKLYLHVRWPVLIVLFSTISLFVVYLLTGEFVGSFVTEDSLSWVILAYAIIYGLLFMLFNSIGDSIRKAY